MITAPLLATSLSRDHIRRAVSAVGLAALCLGDHAAAASSPQDPTGRELMIPDYAKDGERVRAIGRTLQGERRTARAVGNPVLADRYRTAQLYLEYLRTTLGHTTGLEQAIRENQEQLELHRAAGSAEEAEKSERYIRQTRQEIAKSLSSRKMIELYKQVRDRDWGGTQDEVYPRLYGCYFADLSLQGASEVQAQIQKLESALVKLTSGHKLDDGKWTKPSADGKTEILRHLAMCKQIDAALAADDRGMAQELLDNAFGEVLALLPGSGPVREAEPYSGPAVLVNPATRGWLAGHLEGKAKQLRHVGESLAAAKLETLVAFAKSFTDNEATIRRLKLELTTSTSEAKSARLRRELKAATEPTRADLVRRLGPRGNTGILLGLFDALDDGEAAGDAARRLTWIVDRLKAGLTGGEHAAVRTQVTRFVARLEAIRTQLAKDKRAAQAELRRAWNEILAAHTDPKLIASPQVALPQAAQGVDFHKGELASVRREIAALARNDSKAELARIIRQLESQVAEANDLLDERQLAVLRPQLELAKACQPIAVESCASALMRWAAHGGDPYRIAFLHARHPALPARLQELTEVLRSNIRAGRGLKQRERLEWAVVQVERKLKAGEFEAVDRALEGLRQEILGGPAQDGAEASVRIADPAWLELAYQRRLTQALQQAERSVDSLYLEAKAYYVETFAQQAEVCSNAEKQLRQAEKDLEHARRLGDKDSIAQAQQNVALLRALHTKAKQPGIDAERFTQVGNSVLAVAFGFAKLEPKKLQHQIQLVIGRVSQLSLQGDSAARTRAIVTELEFWRQFEQAVTAHDTPQIARMRSRMQERILAAAK